MGWSSVITKEIHAGSIEGLYNFLANRLDGVGPTIISIRITDDSKFRALHCWFENLFEEKINIDEKRNISRDNLISLQRDIKEIFDNENMAGSYFYSSPYFDCGELDDRFWLYMKELKQSLDEELSKKVFEDQEYYYFME